MSVIPLIFLTFGLALTLNWMVTGNSSNHVFPKPDATGAPDRGLMRMLLLAFGALLLLAGVAMLLVPGSDAP